jgi:hypothetical protein
MSTHSRGGGLYERGELRVETTDESRVRHGRVEQGFGKLSATTSKRVIEIHDVKGRTLGQGSTTHERLHGLAYVAIDLAEGETYELGDIGVEAVTAGGRVSVGQPSRTSECVSSHRLFQDAA